MFRWYFYCLSKFFVFKGRASRAQYWSFILINVVVLYLLSYMSGGLHHIVGPENSIEFVKSPVASNPTLLSFFSIANFVYSFLMIFPLLAATIRRLHDRDHSGWWVWAQFIPILNFVLFIFLILGSDPRPNQYGSRAPKSPDDEVPPVFLNSYGFFQTVEPDNYAKSFSKGAPFIEETKDFTNTKKSNTEQKSNSEQKTNNEEISITEPKSDAEQNPNNSKLSEFKEQALLAKLTNIDSLPKEEQEATINQLFALGHCPGSPENSDNPFERKTLMDKNKPITKQEQDRLDQEFMDKHFREGLCSEEDEKKTDEIMKRMDEECKTDKSSTHRPSTPNDSSLVAMLKRKAGK